MNKYSTVTRDNLSEKLERGSGSRMGGSMPIRVAHWHQIRFVPLVNFVCTCVSSPNDSKSLAAKFS